LQDILAHQELPWSWYELSRNPSITLQDVLDHPEIKWSWAWLSRNPNITLQDVLDHPGKDWNWYRLSENPNITLQDVLAYPEIPWDWYWLSENSLGWQKSLKTYKKLTHIIKQLKLAQISIPKYILMEMLESETEWKFWDLYFL
jgi:hypothetical protein